MACSEFQQHNTTDINSENFILLKKNSIINSK